MWRYCVGPLKAEVVRRVTEGFETLPGQQAQIDWGECGTIIVDGERRKLYAFVMVLGYSRMMYARFTTSTRLPVLLGCVSRAFEALGMPAELLVDNMKQAVDQQDVSTGTVRWNSQFLDFVEHFGVLPVASPPYWPRVKGKVERGPEKGATAYVYGGSEYTYGCRKLLMKPGWVPRLEGLHRRTLEKSAGLSPLKSALWHAYRRKWANERKHLPPADVAEMGGWSCTTRCATRAKTFRFLCESGYTGPEIEKTLPFLQKPWPVTARPRHRRERSRSPPPSPVLTGTPRPCVRLSRQRRFRPYLRQRHLPRPLPAA